MARGPRPSPRNNPDAPRMPTAVNLRAPSSLGKDGKRFWRQHAKILSDSGVLRQTDLAAFELVCYFYGVICETRREIEAEGKTVTDKNGDGRKNPRFIVLSNATTQFLRLGALFGLNPTDRNRLGVDDGEIDEFGAEFD